MQIQNIGIIGAGTMGSGIAQVASTAGHTVILIDNNSKVLFNSEKYIRNSLDRLIEKGKISSEISLEIINRITFHEELDSLKDSNLVIEAVIENPDIKKKVFSELEEIIGTECIVGSNTSSLSIAGLSNVFNQPDRFIGVHFFNPANILPLVEIIPSLQTNLETTVQISELMKTWGKLPVIAKDTPGFIVNRIARPFYGEALRILDEGIADIPTIDWAMREFSGFRMGPFELMDLIGNDINYTVTETIFCEMYYDPRFKPSITQKRMVEAGLLGRKTGKGYYDYSDGSIKPEPNKDTELGKSIFLRIVSMLINEAADAMFLNIASGDDIELAMTKGVNYPKGLLHWADELGIGKVINVLSDLSETYNEDRYRICPLLKKMSAENRKFFN